MTPSPAARGEIVAHLGESLREVLRKARPVWTDKDVNIAQGKLLKVGITNLGALSDALRAATLNERLRAASVQTFTGETIRALREVLGVRLEEASFLPPLSPEVPLKSRPKVAAAHGAVVEAARAVVDAAVVPDGIPPSRVGDARAGAGTTPTPATLRPSDAVVGAWLGEGSAFAFEIRRAESISECAVCGFGAAGAIEPSAAQQVPTLSGEAATACTCRLLYWQRMASGFAMTGELSRLPAGSEWTWEAQLEGCGCLQLRRQGPVIVSRQRPPDSADWLSPRTAKRPQLFVFHTAHSHPSGYRYAHVGYSAPGEAFPIIGVTAGWLPGELVNATDLGQVRSGSGRVRVRVTGTFCDPFDVEPSPAVGSQICVMQPAPMSASMGEVLLLPGGGVAVRPPMRPPPFGSKPFGRPSGDFCGGKYPFGLKGCGKSGKCPGGKGVSFPGGWSTFGPAGKGWPRSPPNSHPIMDTSAIVAAAFRVSRQALRDHAIFRGKLRPLPQKRYQENMEVTAPVSSIRLCGLAPEAPDAFAQPPRPLLSVVCLRWFNYWSDPERCSDYSTLNDGYFLDLFDGPCSMGQLLPCEHEVVTIFIRCTEDLRKLQPQRLRSVLSGRNVAAWYFVWPSTSTNDGSGYVSELDFFALCSAMERVPIRSCWPHESSLYRELCGKLWIPQMCISQEYRVPPTTRVHLAEYRRDSRAAAQRALLSLFRLRKQVWNKDPVPMDEFRGVVKLGFSWCGCDVLPFHGLSSLVATLGKFFGDSSSDAIVCLVQEMVADVVGEHRIVCFYDRVSDSFRKEALWIENMKPDTALRKYDVQTMDVADFKVASSRCMPPSSVASRCFRGDLAAQRKAEQSAMSLADLWLSWFRTQAVEPPQCTRLDFIVSHRVDGWVEVWTCEVGECGASLCSIEVHGRNLAALNTAILHDPSGRFPRTLPRELPRNTGFKS